MKGFKDSTKMRGGHEFPHPSGWFSGKAERGPISNVDQHGSQKSRIEGNSEVQRVLPSTEELKEAGGHDAVRSGFSKGGTVHKHFHVHHHHDGKTSTKSYEKKAEKYAEGGHVHNETDMPRDYPDYKKGGMHINPKNKGKFTQKMTGSKSGHLTGKDVQKGLHSKSAETRKEANFARMARRGFKPLGKNAGGAVYAKGGKSNRLASGGVPPMAGALGQAAARPLLGPRMAAARLGRGPRPVPGAMPNRLRAPIPAPIARARGGSANPDAAGDAGQARAIARQEIRRHVAYPAPEGHKGLGKMLRRG